MDSGSNPPGAAEASGFGEPALHGLKFGKKLYFEVMGGGSGGGSSSSEPEAAAPEAPVAAALRKKGKGSASGGRGRQPPPPKCQVEGCGEDLTGAKAYYCKHRVCGTHSKSPKVIVAGLEQRFCQQCSRFHLLTEFDQGKRSCRRRLAGHNERRRKPPPVPLSSRYGRVSSFHGNCARYGGCLSDFAHMRVPSVSTRETWPVVQAAHRGTCNHWLTHADGPPTGTMGAQIVNIYGPGPPGSAGRVIYNQEEVHPSHYHGVSDSTCALSLLSNQPWGISYASNGSPAISGNNIDAQMAQSSVMNNWISTSGSFRGPDASCNGNGIPHEMGLGLAAGTGSSDFSGELELALQGNRKYGNHGDTMAYSPPGNLMHWPL